MNYSAFDRYIDHSITKQLLAQVIEQGLPSIINLILLWGPVAGYYYYLIYIYITYNNNRGTGFWWITFFKYGLYFD
jgi:hypothetical protein